MTERYSLGKIYKLVSNMTDDIYIGSCCTPLRQRLFYHKNDFKQWKDGKRKNISSSSVLFELGGDVQIILIEDFATDTKDKLLSRERFYIDNTPCVNIRRPIIFEFERAELNKQYEEAYSAYRKEHYNANKEHILATRKAYRSIPENRERENVTAKQYRLDNREVILQKQKQYDEANKAYRTEKIKCQKCVKLISKGYMAKHLQVHLRRGLQQTESDDLNED